MSQKIIYSLDSDWWIDSSDDRDKVYEYAKNNGITTIYSGEVIKVPFANFVSGQDIIIYDG